MAGSFYQADVQCPFYKYDDGRRRITCEGLTDDSSIALISRTRDGFHQQITGICSGTYQDCPIYKMLMRKYPDT